MTKLQSDFSEIDLKEHSHPAWPAFIKEMEGICYGWNPLQIAWSFFKAGWEANLSVQEWIE